jgi:SNF2 family DNA or RNA helicase
VIRKYWNPTKLYTPDAPFHVLVTSYHIVVSDEKFFHRLKWQYMILDEAQAIKNAASQRWKALLNLKCRNRLLLTGTPIQNSMAELWALLHFIMPDFFDSHDEFNDWFSKDIQGHAAGEHKSLDGAQLKRLHMILQPFMLRRVKQDVELEMAPKIEIQVDCPLSQRQRALYKCLQGKISQRDVLRSQESLMNLVMQFRKVCNHPEIFERRQVQSPLYFQDEMAPSTVVELASRTRTSVDPVQDVPAAGDNPISLWLPRSVLLHPSLRLPQRAWRHHRGVGSYHDGPSESEGSAHDGGVGDWKWEDAGNQHHHVSGVAPTRPTRQQRRVRHDPARSS